MRAMNMRPALLAALCLGLAACGKKFDPADGAASPAPVVAAGNGSTVTVDHPEQYPVVAADRYDAPEILNVTGSVNPDVDREVPVISLASGRVVDIRARLDDSVKKGQLLLKVQSSDVTNAFDAYLKAVSDEQMTNKALARAKALYARGAIAQSMVEQAEDAETDNQADLKAAEEQLQTLGIDKDHPSPVVSVYAPISGVIVAQNVTIAAATGVTYTGSPNAFTIADLSVVWILCDVYENDLPKVRVGQTAQIHVGAYSDRVLAGRISDIGPVLDPSTRAAKVRIAVANPGILKLGMFVTASLQSRTEKAYAAVPASAILHLRDRDWVYVPAGGNKFQRVEVQAGDTLPGGKQAVLSGIAPGKQVVANVLSLEATLEAQ